MIDRRTALFSLLFAPVVSPASAREADFAGGIVSLTYDDGLDSHLDVVVPALEARGLSGTFYVTWENIAARAGEWRSVIAKGHELANHTMTHPCGIAGHDWRSYGNREIAPLNRRLSHWYGTQARHNFAYPCDVTDLGPGSPNEQLARFEATLRYQGIASARTSEGPPNSVEWVRNHPFRLQALAVGVDALGLRPVMHYLHRARSEGKWAILIFHDVLSTPMGKLRIPSAVHEALLDGIANSGMRCRRVCDVVSDLML